MVDENKRENESKDDSIHENEGNIEEEIANENENLQLMDIESSEEAENTDSVTIS